VHAAHAQADVHRPAAAAGRDPAHVQQQVGHTDPTLTLRIYQQLLNRKRREECRDRGNELLGTSPAAVSKLPDLAGEPALGPNSGPNSQRRDTRGPGSGGAQARADRQGYHETVASDVAVPAAPSDTSLNHLATTATLNCLVGCVAGEVTGMVVGTALGFTNLATFVLAIGLAFVFGYTLTSIPLARSGMARAAVVPIALAADTVSITIMEAIDNAFVVAVPGAMDAGLGEALFWWPLLGGFGLAFGPAFLVNRANIRRGKGCCPGSRA